MCNMASVFRLPTRFEESHPLSNGLSRFATHQSHNRFEFTTNMLNALKESMANDQSMESFLAIHEKRASMNGIHILPQKIWLETDIETPLFGHEVKEKSDATKRPAWSTSDTNFFSRIMSFITPPNTSKKDGSESDENSSRRRFVPSSSPVMGSTVLESVTNYNKPTCIFLPQSIVQNDSTTECVARKSCQPSQQKLTSSAIVSAIRSGNMDWLQGNCSTYPVAFWFGNEMEINSDVKTMTELDANLLSVKRKSFCLNAKARSMFDGSYTLLLTGCSSRRNAESVYSYRGFLTNQIVDPNVFKHRYSASLRMVKLFSLQSKRTMCVEASIGVPAPEYEIFFTRMILSLLAKSFIHHDVTSKKTNQDGELTRKAPYSYSLTTSRHGQRHKSPCKSTGAKRTLHYVGPKFHLDVSKIEELAAHFSGECPGGAADIDDGDLDDVIAVEDLGKSSLKVRGELLHLVMKACELEDGKRTFLAEFATANRGRRSSKHITLEGVGDDSEIHEVAVPSGPQIAVTVDPIVLDEKTSMGKRVSEVPIDESKSRKKRKKEKKKKKSKKSRKRKRREDDSQKESRLRETTATSHAEHDKKPNNHTMRVAVPSIPIGMTPIHPPKKLELRRKALDSEHCKPRDGMTYSIDDAHESSNQTSTSAAVDTSPDSVANLNPVHTTIGIECNNYQPDCYPEAHTAEDTQLQTEEESMSDDQCIYTHESSLLTNNLNKLERPPWTLLTSESFLESYGEVIAELASGSWHKSLLKSETHIINDAPKEVVVCDCPLLDITGADVELADNSAVLVQYLSTWSGKADNSHSVSVHHGSRAFMRRLVLLAASGRYSAIHVVLCLDVEMSAALSGDIITVQNAVNQQSGCPAEHVTFEFVAPRSLATSIALKLTSVSNPQDSCQLSEFILDENVRERARFLVMLVPTMTVHMAMRCLGYGSSEINSGEAMHNLFVLATTTQRDLFPRTMEGMLSANASEQLWSALNVDIAHAY